MGKYRTSLQQILSGASDAYIPFDDLSAPWRILGRLIDEGTANDMVWGRFVNQYRRVYATRPASGHEPRGIPPGQFGGGFADEDLPREPSRLDPSDFMEDRLQRLVRIALEEEKITVSRGAEILDLDLVAMKELAIWWEGPDEERRR